MHKFNKKWESKVKSKKKVASPIMFVIGFSILVKDLLQEKLLFLSIRCLLNVYICLFFLQYYTLFLIQDNIFFYGWHGLQYIWQKLKKGNWQNSAYSRYKDHNITLIRQSYSWVPLWGRHAIFKGIEVVILNDSPFIEWHAWFTTIPLSEQEWISYLCLSLWQFIIFNCGF